MKPIICRCCGEPMSETGNPLSRNPNVCASCSSMADGMEESGVPGAPQRIRKTAAPSTAPVDDKAEIQVS